MPMTIKTGHFKSSIQYIHATELYLHTVYEPKASSLTETESQCLIGYLFDPLN